MSYKKRIRDRTIESSTSMGITFVKPYIGWFLTMILSIVLWFGASYYAYVIPVAVVVFTVLALTAWLAQFLWKASRVRRDFGRLHGVCTLIAFGVWLACAIQFGPFHPWVFFAWVLPGLALAGSWNIRTAIKSEKRDNDPMELFFSEHNLEGTKTKILEKSKDRIRGIIQVKRGKNTIEDVQRVKGLMASLFGAPRNGVRVEPDRDDSSKGYFTVVKRDLLAREVLYTPNTVPTGPNDLFDMGRYEDGDPAKFTLHSKRLGAIHMLIQGMNGSGKSEGAKVIFARAFNHRRTALIVIDTTKGNQTLNLARNGIDWIISEEAVAEALFKRFNRVIKARADELGRLNKTKWDEESGLTFLYVHIEEASGLIANNPAFIKMMETARSVGIAITASLQRASYVAIDTAARAQFSAVMCFGVQDVADAAFALPDDVIDAGADPSVWRNSKPGYAYLIHPEVDSRKWVMPLRSMLISDEQLSAAADAKVKEPIDPITMGPLKDLFEASESDSPAAEVEELDDIDDEEMEEMSELESRFEDSLLEFENESPPMSAEEAVLALDERLEELKVNNQLTFTAPELSDVLLVTRKSRAWLHKQLSKRVEQGSLTKDDYTYTIEA